jgi:cellulose biosynthesis protein BcsQ
MEFESLYNKFLEVMLNSSFADYVSKLNPENVKKVEEFNYNSYIIPNTTTGSILYSFEKDNEIQYGLYILAKNDYDIIYISCTASKNWFDKNLLKVKNMIHSISFNYRVVFN